MYIPGWGDDDDRDSRRSLSPAQRWELYKRAKGKCENPKCHRKNRKIEFEYMEVGHKLAWSRRGRTTLANSVCLCHDCNKKQGTLSWAAFMKKEGVKDTKTAIKEHLQGMTLGQLKLLAKKHNVKVSGYIEEGGLFTPDRRIAPSKSKYVNKLSKVLTPQKVRLVPKEAPKPAKKKRRTRSRDTWSLF